MRWLKRLSTAPWQGRRPGRGPLPGRIWQAGAAATLIASASWAAVAAAASAEEPRLLEETRGAIAIPFDMPYDGEASIGIYNAEGRLLRPLAQLLELPEGRYQARWDGMDLFGHLVAAGTDVRVKVITNPGLRAYYEFTVGHANRTPWGTRPSGEGDAMRQGGWMGDHTPPVSAAACGDRLFFGCTTAEHGNSLIMTNLEGEKMWGGGLEGWGGPEILASDGRTVFGLAKGSRRVHRVDPQTLERKRIIDTGDDRVLAMAACDGKVYLVLENHEAVRSAFLPSLDRKLIDYDRSRPIIPPGGAPHEKQISPRDRFANIFTSGGHWQNGVKAVGPDAGAAFILARFTAPVTVGTVVLERTAEVASAEVLILKPGLRYDEARHSPAAGSGPEFLDLNPDYVRFGKADLRRGIHFIPAPTAGLKTEALVLRLVPTALRPGNWPPFVGMCRILENRVQRADDAGRAILPGSASAKPGSALAEPDGVKVSEERPAHPLAWNFRTEAPISDVSPATVVLDYGSDRTFDGICLLGCAGPVFTVDALAEGADPETAADAEWREIAAYKARSGKNGWATCFRPHNELYIDLAAPVTARALRLRFTMGYGGGVESMGRSKDDPFQCDCADVALLRLMDPAERAPGRILKVFDGTSGAVVAESRDPSVAMDALVFDADGTLYSVVGTKLCRSVISGDKVEHTVLNETELRRPVSIAASATGGGRIAVGDAAPARPDAAGGRGAVLLFDRQGKLQGVIGDRGGRKRGPWDPQVIEAPTGLAIDPRSKIWVAENKYAPKRVARFAPDGRCEKELFGPAEYGGGGYLDPNLKAFYYRSMEFELDWAAGTSRLKNLNDRLGDPASPALDTSTFGFTKIGRPIYLGGRRYIVGDPAYQGVAGVVVCLLEGATWRPCAVMAAAEKSPFLVGAGKAWRGRWLGQDLAGKSFIWCDLNGDGDFQVEEVDLFDHAAFGAKGPFAYTYWGNWIGPDLTFWGPAARLSPSRITDRGVPVYERKDLRAVEYAKLFPVYHAGYKAGMRAKTGWGATTIVTQDGGLVAEGQPWRIRPDGSIKGGAPEAGPSDYVPPIVGRTLDNPLHFVGTAVTGSPLGEVAVLCGNSGRWGVVSVEDGLLVGDIFTGREGGWGTGLEPERGIEVTHRRHGSECFFGHFIKAQDARYYAVCGHTFHAISRVEGLDDYRVQEQTVRVDAAAQALNARLRPILRDAARGAKEAARAGQARALAVRAVKARVPRFQFDGHVEDWGGPKGMQPLGDDEADRLFFDAAWDDEGLYLAWYGITRLGNPSDDFQYLFKTGFALDFQYRAAAGARGAAPLEGDRRIVIGEHKGRWIAVLYDYVDPKVPEREHVEFASPVVTTRVARVAELPADAAAIRFVKVRDLTADVPKGKDAWSAEVRLKWSALGIQPEAKREIRCDVGVIEPDSSGTGLEKRSYWSAPGPHTVSDLGVEASLTPAAWGTFTLSR